MEKRMGGTHWSTCRRIRRDYVLICTMEEENKWKTTRFIISTFVVDKNIYITGSKRLYNYAKRYNSS